MQCVQLQAGQHFKRTIQLAEDGGFHQGIEVFALTKIPPSL